MESELQEPEKLFELISRISAISSGEEFFSHLMRELALSLGVSICFVSRSLDTPPNKVRTLGFYSGGKNQENFSYDLFGHPCEKVMRNGIFYCQSQLSNLHPQDFLVRTYGMESYMGVVLLGRDEQLIGHLAVADNKELAGLGFQESLIRVFAARAAAELENMILLEKLQQSEEELRYRNRLLQDEMDMATQLQKRLLPVRLPEPPGLKMAALYHPASQMAGDFYDTIESPAGTGIFICDVSGHGAAAALIASMIKMAFEEVVREESAPGPVLKRLNDKLYGKIGDNFCTALYAVIDPDLRGIRIACGGHPPPLLVERETGSWRELPGKGRLLGAFPDWPLKEFRSELAPGNRLLFYTDGVTEAAGDGQDYELHVLAENLNRKDSREETLELLLEELEAFAGMEFPDDITALVVDVG